MCQQYKLNSLHQDPFAALDALEEPWLAVGLTLAGIAVSLPFGKVILVIGIISIMILIIMFMNIIIEIWLC